MDWHEGFQIYGENGSVVAKTFNPWYYKTSEVDIFREADASWHRPLGADGHFYRRQLEGLADVVLHGAPMTGADLEDGIASVRGMVGDRALGRDRQGGGARRGGGPGLMQLGIFARTFDTQGARETLAAVGEAGYAVAQFNLACLGLPSMPDADRPARPRRDRRRRRRDRRRHRRRLGHLQHGASRPGGPGARHPRGSTPSPPPAAPWARGSSRSAPARATPRTSGAGIRRTPAPAAWATSGPRWRPRLAIAERHDIAARHRARARQRRLRRRRRPPPPRRDRQPAAPHRARPGQPLRAGRRARAAAPGGGGDRPPRRRDRHGARQGPHRRRQLHRRRQGRDRLRPLRPHACTGRASTARSSPTASPPTRRAGVARFLGGLLAAAPA